MQDLVFLAEKSQENYYPDVDPIVFSSQKNAGIISDPGIFLVRRILRPLGLVLVTAQCIGEAL